MKLNLAAVLLAGTACLVADTATAGYFGLGLNQNTVKDWDDVGAALDDGSFTSQRSDDQDTGLRVFAGFGDHENFKFEVGYSDFGEATFVAESNGCCFYPSGPVAVAVASSGIDVGMIGSAPLSENVAVIGHVGLLLWEVDADAEVGGNSGSDSEDGNDFFIGFGLEFNASRAIALRGAYTLYSFDDSDVDSLSVSLVFRGGGNR